MQLFHRSGWPWWLAGAAFVALAGDSATAAEFKLDNSWTIVAGSDPLEQTAAADLKDILAQEAGITVRGPVQAATGNKAIFVGTPGTNSAIAAENARAPFRLNAGQPESYHDVQRGGNLYLVGQSPKGAMNGVYRFLDHDGAKVTGLDDAGTPAFRLRVANHKMNQTPPPNWTEAQQGRYYARHFINVVWGEKLEPPLSYEARRKYGLGVMLEVKFPPGGGDRLDNPALVNGVYYQKAGEKRRVLDPFDPAGAEAYRQYMRETLAGNPDVRIFYAIFGDYSSIPDEKSVRVSDNQPYPHSRAETMKEILRLLRTTAQAEGKPDIVMAAWMWHAFFGQDQAELQFMKDITADGYGLFYNEAGNNDNWLLKRDNFSPRTVETGADGKTIWGSNFLPLVSAGGACESVNPVISMPLPMVAGHKIRRLADIGSQNFVLWWGSAEGWTYDSNLETVAELIWNPKAFQDNRFSQGVAGYKKTEPVLNSIATRDFGKAAPQVIDFWNRFDDALETTVPLYRRPTVEEQGAPPDAEGLHLYDWWQRMGIFTEPVFGGLYLKPLTPEVLGKLKDIGNARYWGVTPYAQANYAAVLQKLGATVPLIQTVAQRRDLTPLQRERARHVYQWSELYRRLLTSQYNNLRAVAAMQSEMPKEGVFDGGAEADKHRPEIAAAAAKIVNSPSLRAKLTPIIQDEIANAEATIAMIPTFAPNFNITGSMGPVVHNQVSGEKEIAILRDKVAAMQAYLKPAEPPVDVAALAAAPPDAMQRKVLSKIANFTDWVRDNTVRGAIGEIGWPGNRPALEQAKWNELGRRWYEQVAKSGLRVSYWATGEAWGTGYQLAPYVASEAGKPLDMVLPPAAIIEAQTRPELRGVNSAGAEFYTEHFDSLDSFKFLKARGITWIRLPFSWGRLQPVANGPLDTGGLERLKTAVANARSAGLEVVLDCHNYMRRREPGAKEESIATTEQLADLWRRLAPVWSGDTGVSYGIMNEPHDLPDGAAGWEKASQAVLDAIRATGTQNAVFIPGYEWSGAGNWAQKHPKPWIHDPGNNVVYEAHNYWDSDGSGAYKNSYEFEVEFAGKSGF